ncbi:unnamed protein product [Mytilus edulis]|uniref:Uncharacterized protein n=1 Tax=Mytilus edulis TaxID=6550 RepID=A0A8S3V3E2_MYTED|nr:unnamed protein product [Mytilus edulis]
MDPRKYSQGQIELPYGCYDAKSLAYFPYLLRGLGWYILTKLNKTLKESRNQFLISVIMSYNEVANRKTKVIRQAEKEWDSLDWNLKYLWKYDKFSVSFNRLVLLLNNSNPSIHGEARLLDPDGIIRRQICDGSYTSKIEKEPTNNFLALMKEQFIKEFGEKEKYVLVMFSNFIPCTAPGHKCSELLTEYATRYDEQILIGYNVVYHDTDTNLSLRLMTDCANIYCTNLKDLRLELKRRKSAKEAEHDEKLETYLFDDEDYPNFKRIVRRFRNRSSKMMNENREIKHRILKHSDRDHFAGYSNEDSDDDVDFLERNPDC